MSDGDIAWYYDKNIRKNLEGDELNKAIKMYYPNNTDGKKDNGGDFTYKDF